MRDHADVIDPTRLDAPARARLIDEIYACHQRIFDGVDRDGFGAYVVESPAAHTRIMVLRDALGAVRGYAAFHVFEQRHRGRLSAVLRMEVGVEPAWRGRSIYAGFIIRQVTLACLRYWRRPVFFTACFVHPSSFVSLTRHTPEVWPRPGVETPPAMAELMQSLVDRFGMRPTDRPGVYDIGWIVRGGGRGTRRALSPEAAFYLERNPDYRRGHGLLTVIPVQAGGVARGVAHLMGYRLRRSLERRRALAPTTQRAALGAAQGVRD